MRQCQNRQFDGRGQTRACRSGESAMGTGPEDGVARLRLPLVLCDYVLERDLPQLVHLHAHWHQIKYPTTCAAVALYPPSLYLNMPPPQRNA